MNPYTFTAYALGASREMIPSGTSNLKIRREREGDNIFYRKKLSGELTFTGEDFLWLMAIPRCEKVGFRIERWCGGAAVEQIFVYFSLTDAKVNLLTCSLRLGTSVPGDLYQALIDGFSKEYNALNVPANPLFPVRAKLDFDADFEFQKILMGQLEDTGRIDDADTWASFLETAYWVPGDLFNKGERSDQQIIFRLVKKAPYVNGFPDDLSGDGWQIVADGITENGRLVAKYAKKPDLYNFKPYTYGTVNDFTKYPDLLQINPGQPYDTTRYIEVTGPGGAHEPSGGCFPGSVEMRIFVTDERCVRLIWEFGAFTFNRNRRLVDVIHYLVLQSCPDVAQASADDISDFFTDPINYATGLPNALKDVLLLAKSDVIGYSGTEAATKAMISLKALQDELKAQFQVYYFLDASGKYRLEHYSYFDQAGLVDLRGTRFGNRSYEFDKLNMPRYERLKFSEAFNDDFQQGEIEYLGNCVNRLEGQDSKETNVSKFDNDLENLIVSAESLNREGFTLLVHADGEATKELGDYSGTYLVNGHLAASNLVKHYYQHGRVLASGLVNGNPAVFKSLVKTVKQDPIVVKGCCEPEYDAFAQYATAISPTGSLQYTELDFKTGALSVATLHTLEDVLPAFPDRSFDDSFDGSAG